MVGETMKMTVDRVRERFTSTGLFRNCLPEEVMGAIKRAIVTKGTKAELLLIAKAREPEALHVLQRIWRQNPGDWSFGYCSCIAEVARLMVKSAVSRLSE